MTTVYGSGVSIESNTACHVVSAYHVLFVPIAVSIVAFTSADVNSPVSLPSRSWNITPSRSVNVQTRPSPDVDHHLAFRRRVAGGGGTVRRCLRGDGLRRAARFVRRLGLLGGAVAVVVVVVVATRGEDQRAGRSDSDQPSEPASPRPPSPA